MSRFWAGNSNTLDPEHGGRVIGNALDAHTFQGGNTGVLIVDVIAPACSSDGWEAKLPLKITAGQESLTDSSEGTEITMPAPRKLDKYGFILNIDSNGVIYETKTTNVGGDQIPLDTKTTERRERKWNLTLNNWERRRSQKLKERLRKGIPDAVRGKVWLVLGGGIREPGLYQQIVQKTSDAMMDNYKQLATTTTTTSKQSSEATDTQETVATTITPPSTPDKSSPKSERAKDTTSSNGKETSLSPDDYAYSPAFRAVQDTIERDIHRTFPRHNLFYEEDNPRDDDAVTTAASSLLGLTGMCDAELASLILNLDRDIRAITGKTTTPLSLASSSLNDNIKLVTPNGQAALRRVLRAYSYYDREVSYCQGMNFIAGMFLTVMNEEEAFWLLVSVMHEKPCHMRGMFGEGMRETHKVLYVAEGLIHLHLPRVARHFDKENIHVTMYATQWLLTQYTSSFKFDLVTRVWDAFLGEGWKIIYRVMLALLLQWQSQLLKMSFEDILAFFRELPEKVNGNSIMETALKINLKTRHIVKLEKEWYDKQKQQ